VSLLFNSYVLPALTCPEAYGMILHGATLSTLTRQNLAALAVSLEQLVGLVGLAASSEPSTGSALENARRYFTPHLIATGPLSAASAAAALVEAPPPSLSPHDAWPNASTDADDADLLPEVPDDDRTSPSLRRSSLAIAAPSFCVLTIPGPRS
jgi:hypothetical protein